VRGASFHIGVVGRVLHLVELMLEGDEQIDWGAAYSALEAVEHELDSLRDDERERLAASVCPGSTRQPR